MIPIISGYIAYSMADRPGLAPGVIGGLISANIGTGFIGGIISGLLLGIVVFYLKKIKVTKNLQSIMPILAIPLVSTLIVGGVMIWIIGQPIADLMSFLTK